MNNNLSPIDEAVHLYSGGMDQRFNLKTAVGAVGAQLAETPSGLENAVEAALARDPWVFFDFQKQNYVPRHLFFKYKKFLIMPTEEEVAGGFLIPGHRLIPFLSRLVHPGDCHFKSSDRQAIPWKKTARCLRDLDVYFSLYNTSAVYHYLFRESHVNGRILEEADGLKKPLSISVLDMAAWFYAVNFQPGDSIQVTIDDWKRGSFTFARHEKKPANDHLVGEWCNHLEEVVREVVFDLLGPVTDLYEQLALAFFLGADSLIHKPQIHVGGFLAYMEDIMLTRLAGEPIFWMRGEPPEEALLEFSDLAGSLGQVTDDSINGVLSQHGLAFGDDELEAYMRDELYNHRDNLESVLHRYFKGRPQIDFANSEQEENFHMLCQNLWEKVSRQYNRFVDQIPGRSRASGLKILDEVLVWMRDQDQVEMTLSNKYQRQFVELSGMATILTEIIVSLNDPDLSREEAAVVFSGIEQMDIRIKATIAALRPRLTAKSRPAFRVIQGGKGEEKKKVYQLKVELEERGSPVWRRLRVRGDCSLAELHLVIQAAMGWTDDHHHVFQINGCLFGNQAQTENRDCLSELETLLSQVLPAEGEPFLYEYDFRNSWRHLVVVEEINELTDLQGCPECLEGQGNRPAENANAPEYRQRLKVLADSHQSELADLEEAPQPFGELHMDAINLRLKRLSSR